MSLLLKDTAGNSWIISQDTRNFSIVIKRNNILITVINANEKLNNKQIGSILVKHMRRYDCNIAM